MTIYPVIDEKFAKYGKIVTQIDVTELCETMNRIPMNEEVVYEPSVSCLEEFPVVKEIEQKIYGELPIEVGYCMGKNHQLNALEYHKGSELNICVTDVILMLGMLNDVEEDGSYDTEKVEMFSVPAGTTVQLYETTLHYAPCHVEEDGFKTIVILPKGTNTPLEYQRPCGRTLLAAKNKWVIGHPDAKLDENIFLGLKGKNISLDWKGE